MTVYVHHGTPGTRKCHVPNPPRQHQRYSPLCLAGQARTPFLFLRKGEVDGGVDEEGSFQYDWFDEGTQDSAVSLGQRRDGGGITQRQHGSSAAHRESAVYLWTGLRGAQQQSKRLPLLLRDMKRERGSIGRRAAILHPRWLVSPPDPHLMAGVMHPESNTK